MTLGAASLASTALAQSSMPMSSGSMQMKMTPQMEMMRQHETMAVMKRDNYAKCYGVNASFKNDCKSTGHSCAGFRRLRAKRLHPLRAVMRSVVPLYALSALYVVIGPIFALLSRLE